MCSDNTVFITLTLFLSTQKEKWCRFWESTRLSHIEFMYSGSIDCFTRHNMEEKETGIHFHVDITCKMRCLHSVWHEKTNKHNTGLCVIRPASEYHLSIFYWLTLYYFSVTKMTHACHMLPQLKVASKYSSFIILLHVTLCIY